MTSNLPNIYAQVSDDLERVKLAMDEKGMSMTDGQPLIKIKQAIAKMKDDICNMDTRIGVVQHILLQVTVHIYINIGHIAVLPATDYRL